MICLLSSIVSTLIVLQQQVDGGILFPKASKTRDLLSLDGLWYFSLTETLDLDGGLTNDPGDKDLHLMPVPASYNDVITTAEGRDHVGPVFYERSFIVPDSWRQNKLIWLRFGSVCYEATVYINNKPILHHTIGHLPFVGDVTKLIEEENVIRVVVNNTLTTTTIPQGNATKLSDGRMVQDYTFDFFNYAGIDRPVYLYTTAVAYIDDITINTSIDGSNGIIKYSVDVVSDNRIVDYKITIFDKLKKVIAESNSNVGEIEIAEAKLWWPYLMDDNPGYLYTFEVDIYDASNDELLDTYSQLFGIRELAWNSTSFTINGKPIYFRGFGRHEDSDIRGKGLDLPLVIRDHNLIRWIGGNSYRTSHYPYAEEIMDMADRLGIMIIDEVPAVDTDNFNAALLENHKRSLTELFNRDKNRPSVVVWSIANEPRTQKDESEDYYREVSAHIKSLDETRPITIANAQEPDVDHSGQFLDVLCFNIYTAWYENTGDLDTVFDEVVKRSTAWHTKHNKPVMVTEYGADTIEGLHFLPEYVWSEEYQVKFMEQYFKAYDHLRDQGWFIGEMIWNFADFKTAQTYTRVGGNKKGVFTRQRQPKASAHYLRRRYWALAEKLDGATQPLDLDEYIIN